MPMETSIFQPAWSPWDTSGHCTPPREQMPALQLGCNLPPHSKQSLPEEVFSFPPDCGLSGSGQQWGSQLGLYHHSVTARAPLIGCENATRTWGGQGGELCGKRSRAQFTLAELQPCVHVAHAPTQREPREDRPLHEGPSIAYLWPHSLCQGKHGRKRSQLSQVCKRPPLRLSSRLLLATQEVWT